MVQEGWTVKRLWVMALMLILITSEAVSAESLYKIMHKDKVAEDWEVHADYPLFTNLENEELQNIVNHRIIQKLEHTAGRVQKGAADFTGVPYLYYEESAVYQEKNFYSVIMTSHISRGNRYNSTVTSVNFEDRTGGEVKKLQDLFDMGKLNKEVKKVLDADPDLRAEQPFAGVRENTAFYIKDEHLVLIFNKFEVAAGVHGTPEVPVPIKGLLKTEINAPQVPIPSVT